MGFNRVLIVSDNEVILSAFVRLLESKPELSKGRTFAFVCGPKHDALIGKSFGAYKIQPLDMKTEYSSILDAYDVVISAHSKQIFPAGLVNGIKCINIHPGYNPFNRGWYPQAFSIMNGLPLGATIHEIDEKLDHGKIIAQERVEVNSWDTSLTAYEKVQEKELELMNQHLLDILEGTYSASTPKDEGNLNLKKDFEALREINLDEKVTYKDAINRLRALTHGSFKNAYFIDPQTGVRVWIRVELERDEEAPGE